MIPFDAHENKYSSDVDLCERYPLVEAWLTDIDQPPALPVPLQLVSYYFHTELRQAQRDREHGRELSERARRLLYCMEMEFFVLLITTWWNEARKGSRQFFLTPRTVDVLESRCVDMPTTVGLKPVQVILEYMRTAISRPSSAHNWVVFRQNWMEDSAFVWAAKETGEYDANRRPVLEKVWADKDKRRLTLTENSARMYKRNTVFEKTLTNPDLDKVPGLVDVVQEQRWNLHNNMRLGDVIANLLQLYNATRSVVDTLKRQGIGAPRFEDRYRNDPYVSNEAPYRCLGYRYNDQYHREDRYEPTEYRERISRRTPTPPRHHDDYNRLYRPSNNNCYRGEPSNHHYRGEYRDLDGEAAARNAPILEHGSPLRSPGYAPEEVYELPNQTPAAQLQGDAVAGPSSAQRFAAPNSGLSPGHLEVRNRHRDDFGEVVPEPRTPGSWGHKLMEAAKRDLRSPPQPVSGTGFVPGVVPTFSSS